MPNGLEHIGKFLVLAGIILIVLGGLFMASSKFNWIGRLPGDILIQRKNFTFYFPVMTGIIISIVLTLIFWFMGRR